MRCLRLSVAAAAVTACLAAAAPAPAQIVRGQVLEEGSQTPVEGAMVLLLELDERTVRRVLTDASGGFILDADRPGPHLIRVERIGYQSLTTPRFDVPVEGTFQRVLVPIQAVELAGIDVSGARRCEVRGEQGEATARAWDEARKALEAAAWTLDSGAYRYTLLHFERNLDPQGRPTRREVRRFDRTTGQAPYVSAPAQELVDEGFIRENPDRTLTYFAPDAASFLSEAFLDTHCMRLESVRDGEVALGFEPVRGRRVPDIRGTLLLDAATAQLKQLDFTYVNPPPGREVGQGGGQVVFGRLPNGTWIVREWSIRMPLLSTDPQRTRLLLTGYQVQGGVVWRVMDRLGSTVVEATTASISGTVVDSGGRVLPGTVVRTDDGMAEAVTEGAGTFFLPGLAEGLQVLELVHPSLDSLGLGPVQTEVDAVAGEVISARLTLPSATEYLLDACAPSPSQERETAVLFGRVRRGGAPAQGAPVRVRWLGGDRRGFDVTARAAPPLPTADAPTWTTEEEDPRWVSTELDRRGIFMLCGVPTRSQVRLEVGGGEDPVVLTVTLSPGEATNIVTITLPDLREP